MSAQREARVGDAEERDLRERAEAVALVARAADTALDARREQLEPPLEVRTLRVAVVVADERAAAEDRLVLLILCVRRRRQERDGGRGSCHRVSGRALQACTTCAR
jgi:hypothetical protein